MGPLGSATAVFPVCACPSSVSSFISQEAPWNPCEIHRCRLAAFMHKSQSLLCSWAAYCRLPVPANPGRPLRLGSVVGPPCPGDPCAGHDPPLPRLWCCLMCTPPCLGLARREPWEALPARSEYLAATGQASSRWQVAHGRQGAEQRTLAHCSPGWMPPRARPPLALAT